MTRFTAVRIETDAFDRTFDVYRVICTASSSAWSAGELAVGKAPAGAAAAGESGADRRTGQFRLGSATLTLIESRSPASGVTQVTLSVTDLARRGRALSEFNIPFHEADGELFIEPEFASGVRVRIQREKDTVSTPETGSPLTGKDRQRWPCRSWIWQPP